MTTPLRRSLLFVFAALAARASSAFAQGCAMCGSSFAQNDPTTQAFNSSVIFLMLAPYAIFFSALGCVAFLYRRGMAGRRAIVLPLSRRQLHPPTGDPKEVTP